MKLGIMQPYFFPYIGYWQLINAVDKYVIYDDVNFIKGGWIHRNFILSNGEKQSINIRLNGASPNKKINEILLMDDCIYRDKMLRKLEYAYGKAKHFEEGMTVIERIIKNEDINLAQFLKFQIEEICKYLDVKTEIIMSSAIEKDTSLKGQDKVLHICELLEADEYWNAIGGHSLYSREVFQEKDIKLYFLKSKNMEYEQIGTKVFIGNLSIVDLLMNMSKQEIQEMLKGYELQ